MISRKESLIIAIGGGGCNVAATVKAQGIESARFVFLDTESALAEIRTCASEVYAIDNNDLKTKYPDMNLLDAFSKVDAQVAEVLQNMLV